MRERGATIADIAILIVSAEEGVKAQTKEAIKTISRKQGAFYRGSHKN
jgi:translation initiation factor IF-2